MELSRKEIYKNQKISLGVTLLSFIVMVLFFIFTNIITPNSSFAGNKLSEVVLAFENINPTNETSFKKTLAAIPLKKEIIADVKAVGESDETISDNTNQVDDLFPSKNKSQITTAGVEGSEGSDLKNAGLLNASLGFNLAERSVIVKPHFSNVSGEEGTVVVDVEVDAHGTVTEAYPTGRGTTTSSTSLKNEARKMALTTKFSTNQLVEEQRGTITITFLYN